MTEFRLHVADDDLPQDSETREARHELLASFLAAYADGELPAETRSQIDAHLAGCARCRRELDMHRTLRERLGREPVPAATAALRDHITTGIRLLSPSATARAMATGAANGRSLPVSATANAARSSPGIAFAVDVARAHRFANRFPARLRAAGVVLLIASSALLAVSTWRARRDTPTATVAAASPNVPLFAAVLLDYRRVTASDLPGRARDLGAVRAAVPFAVIPLANPELRLLAAWTTSLAGEPAAVLAYRWNDRVVLQYLVTEGLLFQSPEVRSLLAREHAVVARDGAQGLLLWAQSESGSVLVGELSSDEFGALRAGSEGR